MSVPRSTSLVFGSKAGTDNTAKVSIGSVVIVLYFEKHAGWILAAGLMSQNDQPEADAA